MSAFKFADFVNCNDIRVIKRRSRLGFADETTHSIRVFGKLRRQNLERDLAVKFSILGVCRKTRIE